MHSGAHSLNPFRYDPVAGIKAARDDPSAIDPVAHGDGPNVDFVVGVYDRDLKPALQFRHRPLRDEECSGLGPDHGANFSVTARAQNVVRIGKKSGNPNGARTQIDLPVGKIKLAFFWIS